MGDVIHGLQKYQKMGLLFYPDGDKLAASGLKNIPPKQAEEVRTWIAANKDEIIKRLNELVTSGMIENFSVARTWILEHEERLRELGFTTAHLFGYGECTYPCGSWGVVWLNLWSRPDIEVCIIKEGIKFQWENGGRIVSQIARS